MNVLFDTSVLVPALVDQLSNHESAFYIFSSHITGEHRAFCSTHCLVETYSVLTSLPLPKRISSIEARILIEQSILGRLQIVPLDQEDYIEALSRISKEGLTGGIIYDALHVEAAKRASCSRIYTYNIRHFRPICPPEISVSAP